jgi:hypothetical protein
MNKSSSHQFLLIGLPSTGKTSFLAALWYMVNQSEIECALSLDRLEGESGYLNQIRDAWLEYKPVARNPLDSEKAVSMILKRRDSSASVELTFPDLSGESFRLQWAQRQFTTQYDQRLREAKGAILFVHPENISKPHRIDKLNELVAAMGGAEVAQQDMNEENAEVKPKPWNIEKAPTQVQLVELLQFISGRDYFRPPFRLAIVISAWDLVSHLWKNAGDWLSSELPLLRQFLDCNEGLFEVDFYGVSAQGGRYASSLFTAGNFKDAKAFVEEMSKKSSPVSEWLWSLFDVPTQTILLDKDQTQQTVESVLIRSFNQMMANASIYDEDRFKGVKLRPETKEIMKGVAVQMGEEAIRLNRLLLEDAYPSDLTRTRQYAEEATALQKKKPGRRVLLVGSNVKNPHDITEPVQWLMH